MANFVIIGAGISGKVWSDANGNGALDAGESGVAGVEVCASNGTHMRIQPNTGPTPTSSSPTKRRSVPPC